jgi:flavin reductase (DIM6/NTAB) family NADH-FMN oxidoreductase RutF
MLLRRRQIFLNGVNVVLCGNGESFQGASIAWGTKVEKDHAMVSLPKHGAVTNCISHSGVFTISVLSSDQSNIARQYGGKMQSNPHDIESRDLNFTQWAVPVVQHACAQLLCHVRHRLPINEQVIFIGEIAEFKSSDNLAPLVYDHGHYFPEETGGAD